MIWIQGYKMVHMAKVEEFGKLHGSEKIQKGSKILSFCGFLQVQVMLQTIFKIQV